MAKNVLPTNFQDDIMNSSMGGKRKYKLINNVDGTVSLEDATTYDQVGSNFAAGQINGTNAAVNESADKGKIIDSLAAIAANTQDGYIAGAKTVKELNSNLGDCSLLTEGSGVDTKYYIQKGADTVSKKLLGSGKIVFLGYFRYANHNARITFPEDVENGLIVIGYGAGNNTTNRFSVSENITSTGEYSVLSNSLFIDYNAPAIAGTYVLKIENYKKGNIINIYSIYPTAMLIKIK